MDGEPQLTDGISVTFREPISFASIDQSANDRVAARLEDLGYLE
jgi:hypothetical protein